VPEDHPRNQQCEHRLRGFNRKGTLANQGAEIEDDL
jgi:hypothetical protein